MSINTDTDPDFSDEFCAFLQRYVANVDAAELLLLLMKTPEQRWQLAELTARLGAPALPEADVQRCLDLFHQAAMLTREPDRRFVYRPSPSHDAHVATLARLYIERPVTLFRVIYALRDAKIKTFADAFRLRG